MRTKHFRYLTPALALDDACALALTDPNGAFEIAARVKSATFGHNAPEHVAAFDAADALQDAILINLNR